MARIPYADTRPGAPGTPEFTMAQEGRRKAKGEEEEFMEIYRMLLEMQKDPSLPSSEMQEVDDLIEDMDISGYGREEAGIGGAAVRGAARFLGKATKSPTAQRILSGVQTSAKAIKDRAARILGETQPKAKTMPGQPGRQKGFGKSRRDEPDLPGDFGAGRRASSAQARSSTSAKKASTPWRDRATGVGAVGAAGMVGLGILDQFEEEEEQPQRPEAGAGRREDVIIGPETPPTRPEEQPEEIPTDQDEIPTDQDIEDLFNGKGLPEASYLSAAFRRERDKAFGRLPGDVYYEEKGMAADIPFSETPEGKAFAESDMMPPELVKPADMSDEEWAMLSDEEKRMLMQSDTNTFDNTFGAGTQ